MAQHEFIRSRLVVRGRVQGVGFRRFAYRQAQNIGISGWVRNNPDGSVEIEAAGENTPLQLFIKEMQKGPFLSRVDEVEETQREPLSHLPESSFAIR